MSTLAQVRRLAEPFVAENDDLALVGREIVVRPVHHLVRGVYIDRTSTKGMISPWWSVRLLFSPPLRTTGSNHLLRVHGAVDDPQTKQSLNREMTRCLDEVLRPVADIEAVTRLARINTGRQELSPLQESLVFAARGDFKHAVNALSRVIEEDEQALRIDREMIDTHYRREGRPWVRKMEKHTLDHDRLAHLRQLLGVLKTGGKQTIADLLREWERQNAIAGKVDHLWQSMPFPFELPTPPPPARRDPTGGAVAG